MAGTYADLTARIADELDRSDLTSQIALAVLSAIVHYERERWWWNESRSNTVSTVAGQEFYTSADSGWIDDAVKIDTLNATITGTRRLLKRYSWDFLEDISSTTTSTSQPDSFAYFAAQLRFYPIPDAVYVVRFNGVFALTALSGGADTNAWTTTAEDLIRARAKWDVLVNTIKDLEGGAVQKQQEGEAYQALRRATTKRAAGAGIAAMAL